MTNKNITQEPASEQLLDDASNNGTDSAAAKPSLGEAPNEAERQTIEGLNKIASDVDTAVKELSKKIKIDSGLLLTKLAAQLGFSGEEKADVKKLLKLAKNICLEYFHTPEDRAFATATINDRIENLAIDSRKFSDFLSRAFYMQYEKPPSATALASAVGVTRLGLH